MMECFGQFVEINVKKCGGEFAALFTTASLMIKCVCSF